MHAAMFSLNTVTLRESVCHLYAILTLKIYLSHCAHFICHGTQLIHQIKWLVLILVLKKTLLN